MSGAKALPLARSGLLGVIYVAALAVSFWLAYQLRFDFAMDPHFREDLEMFLPWVVLLKLLFLVVFRQFAGLLSFFSVPDLKRLALATASPTILLLLWWFDSRGAYAPPRGVLLSDFVLSLTGLTAVRLGFRLIRERYLAPQSRLLGHAKRVGIIGAGDAGASLVRELFAKRGLGLLPVAFFDDDRGKWQSRVHEIPVVGPPEVVLDHKLNLELDEVIIAMPSAPAKRIGEIVKVLQRTRLPFATVPSLDQLATGQVRVSQLRSVQIQDLLNRQPVKLQTESIRQILEDRAVMVTGAGGSIGSELVRQIAAFKPQQLLLVDQCEVLTFQIEQELIQLGYREIILPLVADILDEQRMRRIFEEYRPKVVFHAAAHKHVPMMESQPAEAIKNNVFGTVLMAELASQYGVERFVLISTDKAINPTSVMGATKRLAEIFVQALHADNHGQTKLMAVRFGNVLGSSGSVIPTFQRQIAAGGPVKVTHPEVARYFMTIPEAVGLVLQSAAQGDGGEIFVLDMGKPVKIVDLAQQLIELSGLRVDEDIEIEFVGLRPGEKLFEELNLKSENLKPTNHPKIMRFVCAPQPLASVRQQLETLRTGLHQSDRGQIKLRLKEIIPEYQPDLANRDSG